MAADTLFVTRKHASGPREQLGYRLEIPRMALPATPPPDGDQAEALEWVHPVPPGARIERIQPVGLVEPSLWERMFLQWVSDALNAPLCPGWDETAPEPIAGCHLQLRQALQETAPWSDAGQVPEEVRMRRAATVRGEAVAAARDIRKWLEDLVVSSPQEAALACDAVLVLVPEDRLTIERWSRTLREYDLPVRATLPEPLSRSALARWLVALAALSGWGEKSRRPRDVLTEVIRAPLWSVRAVADALAGGKGGNVRGGLRRRLRESLSGLRRPLVTPGEAAAHFDSSLDPADAKFATGLLSEIARALRPKKGTLQRVVALLGEPQAGQIGLNVGGAVVASRDPAIREAWERVRGVLQSLVLQERAAGGTHPALPGRDPGAELSQLLEQRFSAAATVEHQDPRHGITLLPAALYDGRPSTRLVLAGLGEGGFPRAPELFDETGERWLSWLGHTGNGESFVRDELERQIRLACVALSRCSGPATLSYSTEGTGTGRVYPGPLLSLLVGSWTPQTWKGSSKRVDDFGLYAVSGFELIRGFYGAVEGRADGDDGQITPFAPKGRFALGHLVVSLRDSSRLEGLTHVVESLTLEENHRIGAAQGQVEHTLGVVRRRREHDLESRNVCDDGGPVL